MSSLAKLKRPTLGQTLIQARNQQARITALSEALEDAGITITELRAALDEERAKAHAAAAAASRPEL